VFWGFFCFVFCFFKKSITNIDQIIYNIRKDGYLGYIHYTKISKVVTKAGQLAIIIKLKYV